MRTKTFIMLCLLTGIGLTQLSAQMPNPPDNKTGTGTVVGSHTYYNVEWYVVCNNELADILRGTLYSNYEVHFIKGNFVFANHHCTGDAVSVGFINENGDKIGGTGEAFKIIDIPHKYDPAREFQYEVINCLGNLGTHYVMTVAWNNITGEPTVVKSVCPGSNK